MLDMKREYGSNAERYVVYSSDKQILSSHHPKKIEIIKDDKKKKYI